MIARTSRAHSTLLSDRELFQHEVFLSGTNNVEPGRRTSRRRRM